MVGDCVGMDVVGVVVGDSVGVNVGVAVVGAVVGDCVVGDSVGGVLGLDVVGAAVGDIVGDVVVGDSVGESVEPQNDVPRGQSSDPSTKSVQTDVVVFIHGPSSLSTQESHRG